MASATISRASYVGEVSDEAVTWVASYGVELGGEAATVELLPSSVALVSLSVDGTEAPIQVANNRFAVTLSGRGRHTVTVRFQAPISRETGAPRVSVAVPRVPVSRFELTLEGEKEVAVEPTGAVENRVAEGVTVASVNVPMTDLVTLSWSEAVPDEVIAAEETRANAAIYHLAHAEEGVLYVHAIAVFEVTRGDTSQFDLSVPADAQINRIESPGGEVVDWRVSSEEPRTVTLFLDQRVAGEFRFDVHYEKLTGTAASAAAGFEVPVLSGVGVHRQRGMLALLSSRELTLQPSTEEGVTRVGENQLPAFVRDTAELTVAHTFRYAEPTPRVVVLAAAPERRQGRMDARVDTLISLGDVTTHASATVEIDVKSGSIMELELTLPLGVNFLELTAPSLRTHEVEERDGRQLIRTEFTQELDGQFRVELSYERIHADEEGEVEIPTVRVEGAEVEQGRIAVEALTAVEVQTAAVENLSTVEASELPQQLVMRTTNPILLAFKYVQADPAPRLALRVTRHQEIDVQAATIDAAHYRTLYTRDGFIVTTARFLVRNSRQQFLRVRLPRGAEVWSATVAGESESPALADGESDEPEVLIKIINSTRGFPVELIYATRQPRMGFLGRVTGSLPTPDMVVTETRWDVFLPDDLRYGEPESDMDVVASGVYVSGEELAEEAAASATPDQPPRIRVPNAGMRYSFEMLYANQTGREIGMSIPYSSERGAGIGQLLAITGTVLVWIGLFGGWLRPRRRTVFVVVALLGVAALAVTIGYLGAETDTPVELSMAIVALAVLVWGVRRGGAMVRVLAGRFVQPPDEEVAGLDSEAAESPPTPDASSEVGEDGHSAQETSIDDDEIDR